MTVSWKTEPDDHDYPAAGDYRGLVADPATVDKLVAALKSASIEYIKAKDILCACRLQLLPVDNPHVRSGLAKIKKRKALSAILLVRGKRGCARSRPPLIHNSRRLDTASLAAGTKSRPWPISPANKVPTAVLSSCAEMHWPRSACKISAWADPGRHRRCTEAATVLRNTRSPAARSRPVSAAVRSVDRAIAPGNSKASNSAVAAGSPALLDLRAGKSPTHILKGNLIMAIIDPLNQQLTPATADRLPRALALRTETPQADSSTGSPPQIDNGDEARYTDKSGTYTKGILQDGIGLVDLAYDSFKRALATGNPADFAKKVLGGPRTLDGPQAGLAFYLDSADAGQFALRPAPAVASEAYTTELVELYWTSMLRDVAFTNYKGNATAKKAATELSSMPAGRDNNKCVGPSVSVQLAL